MDDDERLDFLYKNTAGLPLDWHIYGFTPDEIKKVSPLNTLSEALRTRKTINNIRPQENILPPLFLTPPVRK